LWIFGWDRLPKKLHLATIWLAAAGTALSAYFILAANAWMQHPVGYELDPETGRAVLNDIGAVLFQNTATIAFFHTLAASFLVSGAGVAGVAAWMVMKNRQVDVFRPAIKVGAWTILVSSVLVSVSGDMDMKIMVEQQPMKVAAAEAIYETQADAPFSVLSIGDLSGDTATDIIAVPGLLSWLATGDFGAEVQGINDLQQQYLEEYPQYGPEMNYVPYVPVTYWGFRLMIGLGMIAALYALWVLWAFRGNRVPRGRFYAFINGVIVLFPLLGISAGWIFTEMGRQPWIVFGEQITSEANSPLVGAGEVWISMIGFTLLYAVLAVIEVSLLLRQVKKGAPEVVVEDPYQEAKKDDDKQLYFAY